MAPVTTPTLGSNVEEVKQKGRNLEVWDVGGQESMRPTWPSYVPGAKAVVMVVDASDRARMPLAKAEMRSLLERSELTGAVLLVLANKQDLDGAMTEEEVEEALALEKLAGRAWRVQPCSATTGFGLAEGFSWAAERIRSKPGGDERRKNELGLRLG